MGAWIETDEMYKAGGPDEVAPYVGAWIETLFLIVSCGSGGVAPYVGAWIETDINIGEVTATSCRTLRGCVD